MKSPRTLKSLIAQGEQYAQLQAELHGAGVIYQPAQKTQIARVIGVADNAFYEMQYDQWIELRNRFAAWFRLAQAAYHAGELPAVVNGRAGELLTEYQKVNPFTL